MSAPQLRPLGIGEILDVGMKIAWRNAGTLIRAVVFVVLPVQILSTVILLSSIPDGYEYDASEFGTSGPDPGVSISGGEAATFATGVSLSVLLPWLAGLLATGACFRAIVSAYLGESTGWRESLGYALRRAHSILWVTILVGVISVLGFLLCIVPGVYLYVCFAVAIPVLLTEGVKGTKALGRSRRLVSGTWWRVLAIVVLSAILVGIIGFAITAVAAGVTTVGAGSSAITVGLQQIVTGTVSSVLTTPLTAAFTTILYFDLRIRKEGFDLWLLAERLGVEPPEGYVAPAPQPGGLWGSGSEQPPYWPPPPGWQPSGSDAPQPPRPAARSRRSGRRRRGRALSRRLRPRAGRNRRSGRRRQAGSRPGRSLQSPGRRPLDASAAACRAASAGLAAPAT